MDNIKIAIAANGTTTLATAGKYCDRNVDVEVNVAGGGGGIDIEPIVLTGDCSYGCSGELASQFIDMYGDKVSTDNITTATNMFLKNTCEEIPFELSVGATYGASLNYMFAHCHNLKSMPTFSKVIPDSTSYMFVDCYNLNNIPEDFGADWDWSQMKAMTSGYSGSRSYMFQRCWSLRKLPMKFLENANPMSNYSYSIYYYLAAECYSLDEIVGLPFPHTKVAWTSDSLTRMVDSCYRLKRLTFKTAENGSPEVVNWKNQVLDLSGYTGYAYTSYVKRIYGYNSGITADKEVKDAATYEALKNDPDWWTKDIKYSRYNHDSAVETINSLPDTTTSGGTNTIKFKSQAGELTDGGAINTLTDAEIAVATAKGWTVSFVN